MFKVLEEIDFSSNLIESIPSGICKLPKLRELRLINNRIKEIPIELLH